MTIRLAIILVLLIAAGGTALIAATFGRETFGASDVSIEGLIQCNKATPLTSGTATNITWYTSSTGTENMVGLIYAWTSDTDAGALLAQSTEDPGAINAAWRTGTLTLAITGGTPYFICAWSNAGAGVNVLETDTTGAIYVRDTNGGFPTAPNPLVEDATGVISIPVYVTYTESATGKTVVIGGGLIE